MARPSYRTFPARVAGVDRMTPHFVRVTFASPELADVGIGGPDQRIKILFPSERTGIASMPAGDDWYGLWRALPEDERSPMRTYTIRSADPAAREIVVDFVAHGDSGPASRWIAQASAGEELLIVAPDATTGSDIGGYEWHPGAATTFLVAGDETAVPAICGIVETLPVTARGAVFLEVPTSADILPVTSPAEVIVTWLPRDENPEAYGGQLDAAVRGWVAGWVNRAVTAIRTDATPDASAGFDGEPVDVDAGILWEVPEAPADAGLYAWLAGEAGTITGLRRHLVRDVGIDRSRVTFMGYWKLGRAEN